MAVVLCRCPNPAGASPLCDRKGRAPPPSRASGSAHPSYSSTKWVEAPVLPHCPLQGQCWGPGDVGWPALGGAMGGGGLWGSWGCRGMRAMEVPCRGVCWGLCSAAGPCLGCCLST